MRKTLLPLISLAVFAISLIVFAATDSLKPAGFGAPAIAAVQAPPSPGATEKAVVETAAMAAVYEYAKISMRHERERSLAVAVPLLLDTRPMAFRKPNGDGYIRSGSDIRVDREAGIRHSQRLIT